ncbi:uncharacterized protein V1516DRAFT_699094 [Lipomyces oligophaga]|uniref:uncharacterized protein n=1 Tax=Lipomyces oligophaga TaxID=45792 RepID=UPI0034CD155A
MVRQLASPVKTQSLPSRQIKSFDQKWTKANPYRIYKWEDQVDNHFEAELFAEGISFLETSMSSMFPMCIVPTSAQLSMLFTFASHPDFTRPRQSSRKRKLNGSNFELAELQPTHLMKKLFSNMSVAEDSIRALRRVLEMDLSIEDLGMHEAFHTRLFKEGKDLQERGLRLRKKTRVLYQEAIIPDGDASSDIFESPVHTPRTRATESDKFNNINDLVKPRNLQLLWEACDKDIVRLFGWGFRCSSAYSVTGIDVEDPSYQTSISARWPVYSNLLSILIEIFERDWTETLRAIHLYDDWEDTLMDCLFYQCLRQDTIDESGILWQRAIAAVFSREVEHETCPFEPIFDEEVENLVQIPVHEFGEYALFLDQSEDIYGDMEAVNLRKRFLALVYDVFQTMTNPIESSSLISEICSYISNLPLRIFLTFLNAPPLKRSDVALFSTTLYQKLLEEYSNAPKLSCDWIYSYSKAEVAMATFLKLTPVSNSEMQPRTIGERALRIGLVLERLLQLLIEVQNREIFTDEADYSSSGNLGFVNTGNDMEKGGDEASTSVRTTKQAKRGNLIVACEQGIASRSEIFRQALGQNRKRKDDSRWNRLTKMVLQSESRLRLIINAM